MTQKIFNIIIIILIVILGIYSYHLNTIINNIKSAELELEEVIKEENLGFLDKTPQEGLMEALEYYDIKYPEIVYAQAILETGNFKSKNCLINNNLFGLYDSKNHRYYSFGHWHESISAYKSMIQYKYKSKDDTIDSYYRFLQNIGYAEDPNYINKIREIVK